MTGAEAEGQEPAPAREVGWWRPVLALIALLLLPPTPLLRLALPIEQPLVLLAPLLAVCALAGWRAGGRVFLALLWGALAVMVLWQGGSGTFGMLERGWAVLVTAAFGGLLLAPSGPALLPRALAAIGVALVVGALLLVLTPGGMSGAEEALGGELTRRGAISSAQWRGFTGSVQWAELLAGNPDLARLGEEMDRQLAAMPALGKRLFPSLLALESLTAMAVAWAFYHRIGRTRLGPPLARLRDVRFNDALNWGVVVGLVLLVIPFGGVLRTLGINLLVFLGALYALRGLGVLVWFLDPGRWTAVLLVVFTVFFLNVVAAVATMVGLLDTIQDWRRRPRQRSQRSE